MDPGLVAACVLGLLVVALAAGVWIFVALLAVSAASLALILGFSEQRIGVTLAAIVMRSATAWELSAIPLFIWMGEILFRSDVSARLFRGLAPLVDRLPGRLFHTNVFGCTLFAAVSGSSAATTATVGRFTYAQLIERGYEPRLAMGSLAGAGSLGLLIPPSILMIVYGILAEVSIVRLFAAGVLPGLLLAGLFMLWVGGRCLVEPRLAPVAALPLGERGLLRSLGDLAPLLLLIAVVLGSIYSGLATPSEAAAVGVSAALLISLLLRKLTWEVFCKSLWEAVTTSCMVVSILVAASFLSTAAGYLHLPQDLATWIAGLGLSRWALLAIVALFYIVIGLILDGISITVMTLPIILPIVQQAGFDPLWFGVFLVIMVELGQITPPVGFNLFVLQAVTGARITTVARAALPFFLLMCLGAAILSLFPGIALWLPKLLLG